MPTCHCLPGSTGSFVTPACLPKCTNFTIRVRKWKPTPTTPVSSRCGIACFAPIARKRTADRFASVSIRSKAMNGNRSLVSGWLLLFRPRIRKFRRGPSSPCQSESSPRDSSQGLSPRRLITRLSIHLGAGGSGSHPASSLPANSLSRQAAARRSRWRLPLRGQCAGRRSAAELIGGSPPDAGGHRSWPVLRRSARMSVERDRETVGAKKFGSHGERS